MAIVFITGLSGVGKSSALYQLGKLGFNVVDTDYGYTKTVKNGTIEELVWDEEKIQALLLMYSNEHLFLSGCYINQGKFYKNFDYVVLLKAEIDVMLERVEKRTTNDYGKSTEDRTKILESVVNVLPLLERGANVVIDTTKSDIETVCSQLVSILNQNI